MTSAEFFRTKALASKAARIAIHLRDEALVPTGFAHRTVIRTASDRLGLTCVNHASQGEMEAMVTGILAGWATTDAADIDDARTVACF